MEKRIVSGMSPVTELRDEAFSIRVRRLSSESVAGELYLVTHVIPRISSIWVMHAGMAFPPRCGRKK